MTYYTIAPPPSLASWVRFFWVLESDQPYCHRAMADGCAEMIFHYKGQFDDITDQGAEASFLSGLHGPSKNYRRYQINQGFGIFGVYLYPFAIPQLLRMPASELSNLSPDLHALFGAAGRDLEENIMLAKTNARRVAITSSFLEKKLLPAPSGQVAVCSVISDLIHAKETGPVEELAKKSFLSIRQFERNFKLYAGFSPKLYSRILRFQRATQQYGYAGRSLTSIAYDCGYYDQSHFINDFKQFSGYHPKQYFSGKAEGVEWRNASD